MSFSVVAWSPDGKMLAWGSGDHTLKLWDSATGQLLRTLSGHSDSIWSVAWSPDGKTLASASKDETVRLWDSSSGQPLRALSGHSVWSVAWSPDGKMLAGGSADHTVKLWESAGGQLLRTLAGHSDAVCSVAWSPDGKTLASGGRDTTVMLWDSSSGQLLRALSGHSVWSVAWSPDGKTLASGSADHTVELWDTARGQLLRSVTGHVGSVSSVAWSPDGKTLASGSGDKTVKLWDSGSGQLLRTHSGHTDTVYSVAWSPDGKVLASGSGDQTVKLWDSAGGQLLRTLRKLTESDVTDYLKTLEFRPAAKPDLALRESYRAAAAVLSGISDVSSLRALSGDAGRAETVLRDDLVPTGAAKALGGNTMLRHEVRRSTLLKLGSPQTILKAMDANPDERAGPVQTTFELYLQDRAKPLEQQSAEELEASLQTVLWLDGLEIPGVPPLNEARTALARAKFLQKFERLAGPRFRGRARELDRLRNFVGILEAETLVGKVSAGSSSVLLQLLNVKPKPAMTIYGPGGIGKSALVMKFFLEHIRLPEDQRIPFAYLDFDSPFLNINDLSTLITEILRQLAMQFPGMASSFPASVTPESAGAALGETLKVLSARAQQPFLLVLDTFEEVQYGGEARAYPLWDMLTSLQSSWPFIRVLISGRAPVETLRLAGKEPEDFELDGVDPDAAVAMVKAAGVEDDTIARALVKQVGRVPLSLLLAASLAQREGAGVKGIENLETTTYFFLAVNDEVIQGQLYERILGHIHDKEVVKLAHPGLVLRRLNADVIFHVLREPCELAISTMDDARNLYAQLALESALVAQEGDGWLTHRPDLRRVMLELLLRKKRKQAEQIHRLAIAYYEDSGNPRSGSPDSIAEASYHRLMLGQRWSDTTALKRSEIRASLSRSLSELPLSSQIFLAEQGYSVPKEVLEKASAAELQNHTAAQIEQLLAIGGSALLQAREVLKGIGYQGANSPLYLAEARVEFLTGDRARALAILDEGLRFAAEAGDETRILDLLCLKAWIMEEMQNVGEVNTIIRHIREYADRLDARLPRIQERAQRLRIARRFSRTDDFQNAATALAQLLPDLSAQEFVSIAPLLKNVFVAVTRINPQPLRNLAPLIGSARIEPQYLEPLLPLLQESVAHMSWKPNSELRLEDLRSGDMVSNGLRRILETDDEKTLRLVAESVDAVLGFWPNRLPYLTPPNTAG